MKWIVREQQLKESEFNAGSKARNDVDAILVSEGYKPLIVVSESGEAKGILKKAWNQVARYLEWRRCVRAVAPGDTVVIQYPIRNHTLFFGNALRSVEKKGVRLIGIIHDLESLRLAIAESSSRLSKMRFKFEEIAALKRFTKIIVHNERMREAIHRFFDVPSDRMVDLEIFDYLFEPKGTQAHAVFGGSVLIAGNLDKAKCGYVYELPKDVRFELYGANYDEGVQRAENVVYRGKVKPDLLPEVLKGSFGLVWDGPSPQTCSGVFGEYLKYNNPHKASLYLASGIPVIVWKESALAAFVEGHGCGIAVGSLSELAEKTGTITPERYSELCRATHVIQKKLNTGCYTKKAILTVNP